MRFDSSVAVGVAVAGVLVCGWWLAGMPILPEGRDDRAALAFQPAEEIAPLAEKTTEHRFALSPAQTLHLQLGWARVRITNTGGGDDVVVRMDRRIGLAPNPAETRASQRLLEQDRSRLTPYLEAFALEDTVANGELRLRPSRPVLPAGLLAWCELCIAVPPGQPLKVHMLGGELTMDHVRPESTDISCGFGQVRLTNVGGPINIKGYSVLVDSQGPNGPVTVQGATYSTCRMGSGIAPDAQAGSIEMLFPWRALAPGSG